MLPHGSDGKKSACNTRDPGSIPGLGRSPGKGNGYPLQYSYLENSMGRGTWQAAVYGVAKNWTQRVTDTRNSAPSPTREDVSGWLSATWKQAFTKT